MFKLSFIIAAAVSAALATPLTTIQPCPEAPTLYPSVTVTKQIQPIAYCVPRTKKVRGTYTTQYPLVSTSIYVSTVIPCAWDGKHASTCTVTKTDQIIPCRRSTSIAKSTMSSTTSHTTVSKLYNVPFNQLGRHAIPGYGGSGICRRCDPKDGSSPVQPFSVTECQSPSSGPPSCSVHTESWVFNDSLSMTSLVHGIVGTRTAITSAGTYTFTFSRRAPKATMTAPATMTTITLRDGSRTTRTVSAHLFTAPAQPWYASIVRTFHGPTNFGFTTSMTRTITYNLPWTTVVPGDQVSSSVPYPSDEFGSATWKTIETTTTSTSNASPWSSQLTSTMTSDENRPSSGNYYPSSTPNYYSLTSDPATSTSDYLSVTSDNSFGASVGVTTGNTITSVTATVSTPEHTHPDDSLDSTMPAQSSSSSDAIYSTSAYSTSSSSAAIPSTTPSVSYSSTTSFTTFTPSTSTNSIVTATQTYVPSTDSNSGLSGSTFKLYVIDTNTRFRKRSNNLVGFGSDDAVVVDNIALSADFGLDDLGNLVTSGGYVSTEGSSTYVPFEKTSQPPTGSHKFSYTSAGLQLEGSSGFCHKEEAIFIIYGSTPNGCTLFSMVKYEDIASSTTTTSSIFSTDATTTTTTTTTTILGSSPISSSTAISTSLSLTPTYSSTTTASVDSLSSTTSASLSSFTTTYPTEEPDTTTSAPDISADPDVLDPTPPPALHKHRHKRAIGHRRR